MNLLDYTMLFKRIKSYRLPVLESNSSGNVNPNVGVPGSPDIIDDVDQGVSSGQGVNTSQSVGTEITESALSESAMSGVNLDMSAIQNQNPPLAPATTSAGTEAAVVSVGPRVPDVVRAPPDVIRIRAPIVESLPMDVHHQQQQQQQRQQQRQQLDAGSNASKSSVVS